MKLRTKIVIVYGTIFLFSIGSVMAATSVLIKSTFEKVHLQDVGRLQDIISAEYKSLGEQANEEVAKIVKANSADIVRALNMGQNVRELIRQMGAGTGLGILEVGDGNGTIMGSAHDPARFGIADKEAFKLAKSRAKGPILRMRPGNKLTIESIAPIPAKGQLLAFVVGGYFLEERLERTLANTSADFIFLMQGDVPTTIVSESVSTDDLKGKLPNIAQKALDVKSADSTRTHPQKSSQTLRPICNWFKRLWGRQASLPEISIGDKRYTVGTIALRSHKGIPLGAIIAGFSDIRSKRIQSALVRSLIGVAISGILAAYIAGYFIAKSVTKPIQSLVEGVEIISSGNLDHKIETSAHGEVKFLVDSFNQMTVSLKENREKLLSAERIAAWQDVARILAHEIKNPLFPIQLSIRSLRRAYQSNKDEFSQIFDECTQTITEEVETLRRMVDEFSSFARMPKPQLQECDLNQIVKDTLNLYAGLPEKVEIITDLKDNIPQILGDKDQLSQAFVNIIKNAIEAMPDGGKLSISIVPTAQRTVCVTFADTGVGMSSQVQEKLFTPYFTTKEGGTGLGMAIVHRIITDHNGTISVESKENAGTKITICLPASDGAVKRD